MSTIRILIVLFFCISFPSVFSQTNQNTIAENIVVNSNAKIVKSYILNKDTTSMSISLYIKGYQSKKKREKELALFKKKYHNAIFKSPSFTIDIISTCNPDRLKTISDMKYLNAAVFCTGNLKRTNPFYIIIKQKDGTFLKWKSSVTPIE